MGIGTRLSSALGALLLAACGGDDDDGIDVAGDAGRELDGGPAASCRFDACGGDPVGTWQVASLCYPTAIPDCPGATFDDSDLDTSGSFTFGDDGSFESTSNQTGDVLMHLPLDCFSGLTCDDLSTPDDVEGLEVVIRCVAAGDGCDCTSTYDIQTTAVGTWSVDGDRLTTTIEDDDELQVDTGPFCVDGDELTLGSDEDADFSIRLIR